MITSLDDLLDILTCNKIQGGSIYYCNIASIYIAKC